MPWKDTHPVEQRIKFVEARLSGEHGMVTRCRMFGISTKIGYQWRHRFEQEGMPGLLGRSRASHRHPNATAEEMVTLVIAAGAIAIAAWLLLLPDIEGPKRVLLVPAMITHNSLLPVGRRSSTTRHMPPRTSRQ